MDFPAENREMFYRHMGHSKAINKNLYQCPLAVNEITRVGKFLLHTVDAQTYVPEPSYESNNKSQDKNDVSVDTEACEREENFDAPDLKSTLL
ncbi:hypothetical protein PoB_005538000 [Plakobranchus ocellatus]|uniref:Uncharacterized protein n=1 Tax=Plakobranchus ocellatus TaxID=259542 RepID=A0AAV4CBS7_9GAST|nr:hypothetical protein PoB_005538000 [Plakobranchus ocellatus]